MPRGAPKARLVADVPWDGWIPLISSNVDAAQYDPASQRLWIRFVSGGVYAYSEVPPRVWEGLLAADSKGKFVHRAIKNHFPFVGPLA